MPASLRCDPARRRLVSRDLMFDCAPKCGDSEDLLEARLLLQTCALAGGELGIDEHELGADGLGLQEQSESISTP